MLNLARVDIKSRAFEAAAARLAALLKTDPRNAEAMYEMAVISANKGLSNDALNWLEKANALSGPREIRWGLALSDLHLRTGRPGPALEIAKQVSARAPEDLSVLMAYAKSQLANRDMTGARSTLTSATRVAEYNPAPQVQIALLQMAANNLGGAGYSLEKALSSVPDYLPALALMTEVALRQGETDKAEKRARAIIAKNPKNAVGYSLLGDIAASRGQSAVALDAYRRAHQIDPSADTLLRLFRSLSTQDGGKPALEIAEQWLKNHPQSVPVQRALGDFHARNGQLAAAKKYYETVLKLVPEDGVSLNNLANVLLALEDPGAIKIAEQAVAKNPSSVEAIDTLGWALFQNSQNERALKILQDARNREPANLEIRYHLAAVLASVGRKSDARAELEFVLKPGLAFNKSADAIALMKTLD
jgi:putative PEP-CTERM system TPR-repeat lipoprotein